MSLGKMFGILNLIINLLDKKRKEYIFILGSNKSVTFYWNKE